MDRIPEDSPKVILLELILPAGRFRVCRRLENMRRVGSVPVVKLAGKAAVGRP